MEHIIAGYLRQVWNKKDWLYDGQHGFRLGYSCESKVFTVCQDTADSLDEGVSIDAIIIDFSKAFDLPVVPNDRLLMKLEASGVDLRIVVWVRKFLVGHTERVRVHQFSNEVRVTSGVWQGSVLGPLLFLAYINDIWMNTDKTIRFFADDCIIYSKNVNDTDAERLQMDLDTLGEWAVENAMKINPGKSKAIRFTRAWVKNPLNYSLGNHKVPEANSCKYLGLILRNNLNWVDQVNHTARKASWALHFVMHVLKKGNRNTKSLAYMSLVCPVLEYGAACRHPYIEGQINLLDHVQGKAAKFANLTNASDCKTLAQRRTAARLCTLFKVYNGKWAWKAIGISLQRPYYLSRVDHVRKIR
jgi:hypothetical protein